MKLDVPETGYYIYTLGLNEDRSQVFYVGKGKGARVQEHIGEAKSGLLTPKSAIIRHLIQTKQACWYHILAETEDEHLALWFEMRTITSYPYGALCNLLGGPRRPIKVWKEHSGIWEGQVRRIGDDGE